MNGTAVVDAKQHGRKISIDRVEAFAGLVQDDRAHHGVLVASAGFQEGAIDRAESTATSTCRSSPTSNSGDGGLDWFISPAWNAG